jgi:protein-arginine kinase activator protein McsA
VRRLRRELARAVKEEQYEEAARIRDEIRVAEEALRGPV